MSEYQTPYTVTLSPCIDLHLALPSLAVGHESEAVLVGRFAGGKGINVSAALDSYGVENRCLCLLGKTGAADFLSLPRLPKGFVRFYVDGSIRENITIHSTEGETRVSLPGEIDASSAEKACDELFFAVPSGNRFVAFCGSVPRALSEDYIIDRLHILKKRGALLLCDSRSLSAAALREIYPECIKPNEFEYAALCADGAATALARQVLLTCGEKEGAFLSENGRLRLIPPPISPISTVGAGDSTLAGFIAGRMRGLSERECLRLALAFGSAACLTEGTTPPEKETIDALYEQSVVLP